jgi:hypothetical protein
VPIAVKFAQSKKSFISDILILEVKAHFVAVVDILPQFNEILVPNF